MAYTGIYSEKYFLSTESLDTLIRIEMLTVTVLKYMKICSLVCKLMCSYSLLELWVEPFMKIVVLLFS